MRKLATVIILFLSVKAISQVNVGGYIQTFNASPYPTHIDTLGKGGYMVVSDTTYRNAITCLRRKYGMAVYVTSENKMYILKDTACANNWAEFSPSTSAATRIISGNASYDPSFGNYYFSVSNCRYAILGREFASDETYIIIDSADSLPRFDVIALDTNETVVYIKGTPAANPIKPQVNALAQIELSFIYVNASSAPAPLTLNKILIYNEDNGYPTEWDGGLYDNVHAESPHPYLDRFSFTNMSDPESGAPLPGSMSFTNYVDKILIDTIVNLTMWIKITNDKCIRKPCESMTVYLTNAGDPISNRIDISDYLDRSLIDSWQQIVIPMSSITFGDKYINGIVFKISSTAQFYIDNVYFVTNGNNNGSGSIKKVVNAGADQGVPIAVGTTTGAPLNLISNNQIVATISPNSTFLMQPIDTIQGIIMNGISPSIDLVFKSPSLPQFDNDFLYGLHMTALEGNSGLEVYSSKFSGDCCPYPVRKYGSIVKPNEINFYDSSYSPTRTGEILFDSYSKGMLIMPDLKLSSNTRYIPVKVNDSYADYQGIINLPLIDSLKRSNDSIFAYKNNSWIFQYKDSIGGGSIDTANKWVNSVTSLNDSTIRVVKGTTTTDITIRSSATVTSATRLITTVYNNSGSTITKGSVVYINGAHSSVLPSIALAQANQESTSAYTYGLVENDIANSSSGTVIQSGNITNLNLPTGSGYADGQTLYLSPTVPGGYTTTKPTAPNHYVAIGTITRAHPTQGTIQIAIRNGFQLDEMSDVSIALVPNDSTLLQFSRVDSLWHDVSPLTAIGSRYIKPTDTATMLTNYAKTSAVNLKLNISDTSAFQRKNIGAYSFLANKTSASANATNQTFRDTSGTYTGSIAWTGTTAPSSTTNHSYRWAQVGKLVTLNVQLVYATAGSALTAVTFDLPSDCPTPAIPAGISGNSRVLYYGSGNLTGNGQLGAVASRCGLIINSSSTGYSLTVATSSGSFNSASITVQYFVP